MFVSSFIFFKILAAVKMLRVSREVELEGLDGPEMGSYGLSQRLRAGARRGSLQPQEEPRLGRGSGSSRQVSLVVLPENGLLSMT